MTSRRTIAWALLGAAAVVVAGVAWWMLPPRALGFAGDHTVALADYQGANPTGVPAELANADPVSRGRYLAQAADCKVCHTARGGAPFAGGQPFKTAFGTIYSPNITPDPATGIGGWTDAQFLRAVHQGVGAHGERLYPAFPYEAYTLLSDQDALAIKAYLFSLPPVHAKSPANTLRFPFNQRPLMALWALAYSPNQRFRPHPDHGAAWNRGAYLAEALAHCGDCHTPRNLAQALDNRRKYAGAPIPPGWRAYNISTDRVSGVGDWTDDELARYITGAHVEGRGSAAGPMAEAVEGGLGALTPSDQRALVAYLRTVPAQRSADLPAPRREVASNLPKAMPAQYDVHGRQIFEQACASCHGWSGASPLSPEANLTGVRAVNDGGAVNIAAVVIAGQPGRGDGGLTMPAFGQTHSDSEIAAVANYVTARFGAAKSRLTAADVAKLRP
jgi:mono/diheme cytochrome c family protein